MQWLIQAFGQVLAPAAKRFEQALNHPESAQKAVQTWMCDRLVASEYGQQLKIRSIADWQKLPIVNYDDLAPWISTGRRSKLTPEPILFYECTSGSRGAAKSIPYTQALRRSFNQMFCVWAQDLIQNGPSFSTGKLYFCISPQLSQTELNLRLHDDSDYLDTWLQWCLSPFLVAPKHLHRLRNPEIFKHQLCRALLQAEQLEIISIWSPSFLTLHLDYIHAHRDEFREGLRDRLSAQRLNLLKEPEISWTELWPDLKLISCWDSAHAADPAAGLRSCFPNVFVQGKGLLATEAPLTIPLIAAQGCVPVLNEVFFEFEDRQGQIHLLPELEIDQEYAIILSQKGGLYRYRIGDRVRVTHFYRNTPCLAFIGRDSTISDLVGEKLHEAFVRDAIAKLPLAEARFKTLVSTTKPQAGYLLLLDRLSQSDTFNSTTVARSLDDLLSRSPHYQHARLLGQLAPVQVLVSEQIPERLTQYRARSGCTWGDVKHAILATIPLSAEFVMELKSM